jgi:hypothetical protein
VCSWCAEAGDAAGREAVEQAAQAEFEALVVAGARGVLEPVVQMPNFAGVAISLTPLAYQMADLPTFVQKWGPVWVGGGAVWRVGCSVFREGGLHETSPSFSTHGFRRLYELDMASYGVVKVLSGQTEPAWAPKVGCGGRAAGRRGVTRSGDGSL